MHTGILHIIYVNTSIKYTSKYQHVTSLINIVSWCQLGLVTGLEISCQSNWILQNIAVNSFSFFGLLKCFTLVNEDETNYKLILRTIIDGNYICTNSYFHYSNYPYNRCSASLFSWHFAREVLYQNGNNLPHPLFDSWY